MRPLKFGWKSSFSTRNESIDCELFFPSTSLEGMLWGGGKLMISIKGIPFRDGKPSIFDSVT